MVYDKIIAIRSRVDHCVGYVLNHEKTGLASALDYIGREEKQRCRTARRYWKPLSTANWIPPTRI